MKAIRSLAIPAALLVALSACDQQQSSPRATDVPQTDMQKRSYALGQNMAKGLKDASIAFESAYLFAGFDDSMADQQLMTDEEMQATLIAMQQEIQQQQMEKHVKLLEEKNAAATAYLESNKQAEGIVTTDTGLQYRVVAQGEGDKPGAEDTVTVHYEGRLIDGTVFDSSIQRGEPATFPVGGVIAGWTEALQLMTTGSRWELTVPPELGYGARGAGANIGPNEVLIFDVELLSIEQAAEGAEAG